MNFDALAGALWLRPGVARPHNLRSTRPELVARLTRGLPATRLPGMLGSLFGLCSHAHVLCAGMAVEAALDRGRAVPEARREQLALQTLREHLRRIALDWPRQLAAAPLPEAALDAAARRLAVAPAFAAAPGDTAAWLETHWLGHPADAWLAAWAREPAAWFEEWSRTAHTDLAALLDGARAAASAPLSEVPALHVHADAASMHGWAGALDAGLARRPCWQGRCAETGTWTRLCAPLGTRLPTAWLRLGARLAEAVRLARPGAARWLDLGALPLGDGSAVAWVEMARGLLVHHVQLDGRGDDARVAVCHVVAPTEWNFHPEGAVAQVIERMPQVPDTAARRTLAVTMAAYDPCVTFELETAVPREVHHA